MRCAQVLRLMGRTEAEIDMDATMAELDADGDEEISKEEFAPVIANLARRVCWLWWRGRGLCHAAGGCCHAQPDEWVVARRPGGAQWFFALDDSGLGALQVLRPADVPW